MRVGVNLCWLVPGDVGGSEQAVTRALAAVADHGPADVEPVLFALDAFATAHPELAERFELHVMPLSGLLSRPGRGGALRAISKPLRVLGEATWLAWALRRAVVDVVFDAGGTSPGTVEVPRVLGIHDTQPLDLPRNFHPVKVAWLRRALPRAVAASVVVTAPSEFVRGRIVDSFDVGAERVHVVPWNVPPPHVPDSAIDGRFRRDHDAPGPLILQASITYPHKDHATTIAAFSRLVERHPDARLVLAGGIGPAEAQVAERIAASGVADRIIRTGRLDDAEIASLVAAAAAVVVPSRYEGFGIPALEAMAAGTPVIVADAGSLPEIVGDAGVVFPAGDDAQLAVAMHHAIEGGPAVEERRGRGRARAGTFSPTRTASGLVGAWRAAYLHGAAGR